MTDDDVLELISLAFSNVPRPVRINDCPCDECVQLNQQLRERDNLTVEPADLDYCDALLSPEAFRYFFPGLVRLCLKHNNDQIGMLFDSFIFVTLGQPISRHSPPMRHPKAPEFNREQTSAVLVFLNHLASRFYPDADSPKELLRYSQLEPFSEKLRPGFCFKDSISF